MKKKKQVKKKKKRTKDKKKPLAKAFLSLTMVREEEDVLKI